eukprot:376210-Lingulodinium_polyedra.AAC.1
MAETDAMACPNRGIPIAGFKSRGRRCCVARDRGLSMFRPHLFDLRVRTSPRSKTGLVYAQTGFVCVT